MKKSVRLPADPEQQQQAQQQGQKTTAARWKAVHQPRLPHKVGMPLGSGGGGDGVSR